MSIPVATVFDLSPSEKLQLIEDLWDDLTANPEAIPLVENQLAELDRRKSALQNHPETAVTRDEVQRRIRNHDGR